MRIARALNEKSRLDSKDVADSVIYRHEHNKAFCRPERSEVSNHIESSRDSSFVPQMKNDKNIESNNDSLHSMNIRTMIKDFNLQAGQSRFYKQGFLLIADAASHSLLCLFLSVQSMVEQNL